MYSTVNLINWNRLGVGGALICQGGPSQEEHVKGYTNYIYI